MYVCLFLLRASVFPHTACLKLFTPNHFRRAGEIRFANRLPLTIVEAENIVEDPPAGTARQRHKHKRLAVLQRRFVALLVYLHIYQ